MPTSAAGVLGSLVGKHPQYRYEIEVVPLTARSSRVVVNVRVEDIPDEDIAKYNATARLNLFGKIDQLAAQFPPSERHSQGGGVNYALLPNEDLKGLAKRATGNEDNWRQIAQDNGLKSPTDGASLPSIWIRNTLLSAAEKRFRRGQLRLGNSGRETMKIGSRNKSMPARVRPGRASK